MLHAWPAYFRRRSRTDTGKREREEREKTLRGGGAVVGFARVRVAFFRLSCPSFFINVGVFLFALAPFPRPLVEVARSTPFGGIEGFVDAGPRRLVTGYKGRSSLHK